MFERSRWSLRWKAIPIVLILLTASLLAAAPAHSGEKKSPTEGGPITESQRVFTCGHSFHFFAPPIITDMAKMAGYKDHTAVGLSLIGGSTVMQHWKEAMGGDKFKAKAALLSGKVDVLTLSPMGLDDDGIENFTKLALEHNPKIRVTVQESWLSYDTYDPKVSPLKNRKTDHNSPGPGTLGKLHEEYFKLFDEFVRALNKKLGKDVVLVAPVGHAVVALREKIIAGHAPALKVQDDLFTDAIGHAKAPLQALEGYVYFAMIYRRTPVGLGMPAVMKGKSADERLNRLLQEIAWEAVIQHPLSGVKVVK